MTSLVARIVTWIDALWDGVMGRLHRSGRPRHIGFAVVIVAFVALETARQSLDKAVLKVHANGASGVSANSLHGGTDAAQRALDIWSAAEGDLRGFVRGPGRSVAGYQTIAELFLVPFTFVVYYGLTKWLRGRNGGAQRAALIFSSAAVAVYAVLGVVNQVAELIIISNNSPGWVATPLEWSSRFRAPSLWLILVPVAAVLAPYWRTPLNWFRDAGSAYRVLIAVAVVHLLLLSVSIPAEQTRDALRLWPDDPKLAVWGLLATSGFSMVLAVFALRFSGTERTQGGVLGTTGTVVLLGVGALIGGLGVFLHDNGWGHGVTALGVVIAAVAALSLPVLGGRDPRSPDERAAGRDTLETIPAVLAFVPLLALTQALVKTAVPAFIDENEASGLIVSAAVAVGLSVFAYWAARTYGGWVTSQAAGEYPDRRRRGFIAVVGAATVITATTAVWVVRQPWDRAGNVGVIGLIGVFLILLVVATGLTSYLFDGRPVPAALDFVRLRRIPVVGLIIAWALIGNLLPDDRFHAVRTIPLGAAEQVSVEDAFASWVAANVTEAPAGGTDRQAVPIVFVMAAGGGIKAAAFTASALECMFASLDPAACTGDTLGAGGPEAPDRWGRVFAASGASGGSVGIASMKAQRAGVGTDDRWVFDRLGTDLLSPELAWQLFVETPNTLLTFNPGMDRAEVLERTWEGRFEQGSADGLPAAAPYFVGLPEGGWDSPLLFLNGTNLLDGCRVNVSLAGPGTVDRATPAAADGDLVPTDDEGDVVADGDCRRRRIAGPILDQTVARNFAGYLCPGTNIALSTAAFLSARFPVVSPAGEIEKCGASDEALAIGDAGYRDNTGASAIADVWTVLEPLIEDYNRTREQCIVPLLVEIDNGYANRGISSSATSLYQLTAPLSGILGVIGSRDAGPIEALAAEFSRPSFGGLTASVDGTRQESRFVRVSLFGHPGVTAPLGWSLSKAAIGDITRQLDGVEDNKQAAETVTSWLNGSLTCS